MRFKEFLGEVADTTIKSKIVKKTKSFYHASATFNGKTIHFFGERADELDQSEEDDPFNTSADGRASASTAWEVWFEENGSFEKTGTGQEFKTAAAVVQMMEAFIKRYSPTQLTFTAQKDAAGTENRSRVYLRLINRHFKDWEVQKDDSSKGQAEVTMVLK